MVGNNDLSGREGILVERTALRNPEAAPHVHVQTIDLAVVLSVQRDLFFDRSKGLFTGPPSTVTNGT